MEGLYWAQKLQRTKEKLQKNCVPTIILAPYSPEDWKGKKVTPLVTAFDHITHKWGRFTETERDLCNIIWGNVQTKFILFWNDWVKYNTVCGRDQVQWEWVFEKWKVKKESFHSFLRSAKWKKCFHSFSRSEKWNQNASRSRSEISREFLTFLEKQDFWTDL